MAHTSFLRSDPYQDAQKVQRYLDEVGNNSKIVDEIASNKTLAKDKFNTLFHVFYNLQPAIRKEITEPWQLLVISGDAEAFANALNTYKIDKNSQTTGGLNILHLVVLGPNPALVDDAIALGIPLDSKSKSGLNALEYAAASGYVNQIDKIIEMEQKTGTTLTSEAKSGPNALMLASLRGHLPAVKRIQELATQTERGIDVNATFNGYTAANFAVKGNNQQVIKHLSASGLVANLDKQDAFNYGDVPQHTQRFEFK